MTSGGGRSIFTRAAKLGKAFPRILAARRRTEEIGGAVGCACGGASAPSHRSCGQTGSAQAMASAATAVMPNGAKRSRVAATEPSTSMPRQASSITTTAKPSRRASSAE
jgi:hypothetical protein